MPLARSPPDMSRIRSRSSLEKNSIRTCARFSGVRPGVKSGSDRFGASSVLSPRAERQARSMDSSPFFLGALEQAVSAAFIKPPLLDSSPIGAAEIGKYPAERFSELQSQCAEKVNGAKKK